jgi:hypothetical protein
MVVVSDVGFSLRANGVEGILDVVPGTEATPAPLDRLPGRTPMAAAR